MRTIGEALSEVGPPHEQEARQAAQEYRSHPRGHAMCARRAEIPVDDDDGDEDGEDVHDEGEKQILGDERDGERCGRQDLGDEQHEDDECQQDRNAHRHLLARISGQVEDTHADERDEDAGNDEVYGVEERLTADDELEDDAGDVMLLDGVVGEVVDARTVNNVPRAAVDVVAQVDVVTPIVKRQIDLPRTSLCDIQTILRLSQD